MQWFLSIGKSADMVATRNFWLTLYEDWELPKVHIGILDTLDHVKNEHYSCPLFIPFVWKFQKFLEFFGKFKRKTQKRCCQSTIASSFVDAAIVRFLTYAANDILKIWHVRGVSGIPSSSLRHFSVRYDSSVITPVDGWYPRARPRMSKTTKSQNLFDSKRPHEKHWSE